MKLDIENNIVAKVLNYYVYTRNDRKDLYEQVCEVELYKKGFSPRQVEDFFRLLKEVPRESNVIRTAAFIQNQYNGTGIYRPTDKVRKGRKEKEMKCREDYSPDYKEVKKKGLLQRILFTKIW